MTTKLIIPVFILFCMAAQGQYYKWSEPLLITDSTNNNSNCDFENVYYDYDDHIYFFWEKSTDTLSTSIYMRTNIWDNTETELLSEPGIHLTRPRMLNLNPTWDRSSNDTILILFYESDFSGNQDLYYVRVAKDSGISQPVVFFPTEFDDQNISTCDYGEVSWESNGVIYFSELLYNSKGYYFSDPLVIDSGNCSHPVINGEPRAISWGKDNNGLSNLYYSKRIYSGSGWSDPILIDTGSNTNQSFSDFVMDIKLFWQYNGGMFDEIKYRSMDEYDTLNYTLDYLPGVNKGDPTAVSIPMFVDNAEFGFTMLAFTADLPENTEILVNEDPYNFPPDFINLTDNVKQNRNPLMRQSKWLTYSTELILTWETQFDDHWAIYASRIFVQIFGGVDEIENRHFQLKGYPNPFIDQTTIEYVLDNPGHVVIDIYNLSGKKLKCIFDSFQLAGQYKQNWNAINERGVKLPAGHYICTIRVRDKSESIVIILTK